MTLGTFLFLFIFVSEAGSHHFVQAGLELLDSSSPTLGAQVAGPLGPLHLTLWGPA